MATLRSIAQVAARLPQDRWSERLAAADAMLFEQVLARVRAGASRSEVLREVCPDKPLPNLLKRLRRYEDGGRDALLDRRLPVRPVRKMDDEARGALRVLALSNPTAGSVWLAEQVTLMLGRSVRPTAEQRALLTMGLARPKGRPRKRTSAAEAAAPAPADDEVVTPLPLAGCELLKAVDEDIGATAALTRAIDACLASLPEPVGPVADDRGGRDERGRFLPDYDQPRPRTEPELGAVFDSVETKRQAKDLPAMRVVAESEETHLRKNRALAYLRSCAAPAGPRSTTGEATSWESW
ncbi:MAG: hypothetical protein JXX28_11520 [Deltaproteobacteria bacterium]|nr:hypothetical protein [Deltaproteobacteria bacterium]